MEIARIEVYQLDLPYSGGTYTLSGGRKFDNFDATFARVITACGMEGWGESTPFGSTYIAAHGKGVRAGIEEIAPSILGMDPRKHDRVYDVMDTALVGHNHAKTPLDVACWDITGKAAGVPVYDLLGGRIDDPVPVISSIYASLEPEEMRARVAEHRALGFKGHSIKIGATEAEGGPALDAARITACLADRKPGEWFQADANGGMTPEHALRMTTLLPKSIDLVLEAPCATWAETARLRPRCGLPIMLDELILSEADLIQAITQRLCDGVNLKISKQGGLTPTQRQRTIAHSAGVVTSIQETTGSDIAFAAILHMAQSTPRHMMRCALDCRAMVATTTAEFDAPIRDGGVVAPDVPGLGVSPDMSRFTDPIAVYER